jgi:hypothetical protein
MTALFARSLDRLVNKRLESLVSRLNLRSPIQCGFRPGRGTLDAIFTLQHLIHSAQHKGQLLFVVFVDFKKAFDRVRPGPSIGAVPGAWHSWRVSSSVG